MNVWRANLRRMAHIAKVGIGQLGAYALTVSLPRRLPGARWPARLAFRLGIAPLGGPQRLRLAFEQLGGTFLKLGQMLALQPDLLSLEYCNALFDLMDRVPPFVFAEVERIVREELGAGPDEVFECFERQPLATASIGQVHTATLAGLRVAVKVRRPAVEAEFQGDIRLMRAAIGAITLLRIRALAWLVEPLSEFVAWTHEELDYRYEARYMERLRANARHQPGERVPAVMAGASTRRVLTVEFLPGITVLAYLRALESGDEVTLARVRAAGFEPDCFARNIIDNFVGDAFLHGMFHADLHPANLMILPGNVVGYIDFGITAVLSMYSRRHLIALTSAYTRGDLDGMCTAFFRVCAITPDSDQRGFRAGLDRLALGWYDRTQGQVRLKKNFTLMMLDMLKLSRATGILPERDVVKYIRSAIALDGLITRFAPGFDVGLYLQNGCDRHLRLAARVDLLSFDRLVGWSQASGRLAADGVPRAAALLSRLGAGELTLRAELAGGGPRGSGSYGRGGLLGTSLVQLATALLGLALLLARGASGGGAHPGANLFTAEALLFAAALGTLLGKAWRLS